MSPGPDVILELRGITLQFGALKALDNVSLSVQRGELFALIGPNGAGKSSVFNCVSRVYRPTSGSVTLGGADMGRLSPHQVAARGVARTFQNIELFEGMTVVQNLMLGRHRLMRSGILTDAFGFGVSRRQEDEHRKAVERIIDFLHLESYRHLSVGVLPYGVQKRVELGRALCMDPTLLLLDEPVAGMNREEREDMARFILDVHQELGLTIVLVEHDMGLVMDLATRIAVLDFGHVIAVGDPASVQANPAVIRAYIGAADELRAGEGGVAGSAAGTKGAS